MSEPTQVSSVAAPMSFIGSWQRTRALMPNPWAFWIVGFVLLLVSIWWPFIILWYCTFGLFLVPYRVFRRGNRKRNRRHAEMMEAMQAMANRESEESR